MYGHTPVPEAVFVNNTVDIDQGCVLGEVDCFTLSRKGICPVPALAAYYMREGFSARVQAGAEFSNREDDAHRSSGACSGRTRRGEFSQAGV